MRVSSAAFIFWLSTVVLTIPSGVWGQYLEDDSIDDKFTTTDDDDPPTNTGWCEFGQSSSKMPNTQKRSPQTSRTFFLLVYTGIFLATRYCMLVDPDWRRYWFYTQARRLCWLGFNNLGCICRERGLIRAIRNNQKNAAICSGTWITVSKEINVTGKSFEISCQAPNFGQCHILGGSRTRLIKGSPKLARFHEIEFGEFSATEGGVALLTGGKTRFESCHFYRNEATVGNGGALSITNGAHVDLIDTSLSINSAINGNGGGVSITGPNSTLTYDRISMGNNEAKNGGAMYIANGANVSSSSFFWYVDKNWAVERGAAFYVDHASLFVKGSMRGNLASINFTAVIGAYSGILSSIWIADDDDPSLSGSMVECARPPPSSKTNRTRIAYCGLGEFAGGGGAKNRTQLFQNTNCISLEQPLFGRDAIVRCLSNGTCVPNVTAVLAC